MLIDRMALILRSYPFSYASVTILCLMHTPTEPGGPLQKRLEAFIKGIEGVEAGDVQAVHQTRVASRRLRELLPLLALDHDVTRTLSRRLRRVTKLLGNVREFDVLLLLVRELAEDSRYSTASLRPIGAAAAQARVNARERLSARLPRAKLERLARRLERASKNLEPDKGKSDRSAAHGHRHTWLWALDARLVHRAVRLREAIEAAGAVYAPEHLHRVRIAVKKLRYAAELVGEVTRRRMAADVAALKAAQDRLGRLHDLGVLIVRAREAQARLSPPI